jgi:hypothetical protein
VVKSTKLKSYNGAAVMDRIFAPGTEGMRNVDGVHLARESSNANAEARRTRAKRSDDVRIARQVCLLRATAGDGFSCEQRPR